MSENTPQLDLLMKDPTLDGHEYFNVKTMMNDNWQKIDQFAGEAKSSIEELEDRLNTNVEEEVVLTGGVQIVDAVKAAPFSLKGLEGRTLVNLLGRAGSMESLAGWTSNNSSATLALDANNKVSGSNGLKVTVVSSPAVISKYNTPLKYGSGAPFYLVRAYVKNGNLVGTGARAYIQLTDEKVYASEMSTTDTTKFNFCYAVYDASKATATPAVYCVARGGAGQSAYFDEIAVYEITAEEATAIASMTSEQVAAKYPYVDSVMPVRNPYVIRYGANLLPPFYKWMSKGVINVASPYTATLNSTKTVETACWYELAVLPNTDYTFSVGSNGSTISVTDGISSIIVSNTNATSVTFNTGVHKWIRVYVTNYTTGSSTPQIGDFTFSNPMLNIGDKALPFVPREDAMLALQTDLYADPLTGTSADSVFEQNGQYYKVKKWHQFKIDSNITFVNAFSTTGRKQIAIRLPAAGEINSELVTKFTGSILQTDQNMAGPDRSGIDYGDRTILHISISNEDSGWGDNYAPTTAEIKAYFLGWKMFDKSLTAGDGNSPYNGSEETNKLWTPLDSYNGVRYYGWWSGPGVPTATPSTFNSDNYTKARDITPYELVYQLAIPTVEPIVSEGQLTFNEGSNQVEVGTGIVLRETVKLDDRDPLNVYINSINSGTRLKYRSGKILAVYKNDINDFSWYKGTSVYNNEFYAYGQLSRLHFDPNVTYSASYLMLTTAPIQSMIGTYAANEKSLLEDLVDSVTQQEVRLSTVENKKLEKDTASPILTPTLINGVTLELSTTPVEIRKMSDGLVLLQGSLKFSGSSSSITAFTLPVGYRPKQTCVVLCSGYGSTKGDLLVRSIVGSDGNVSFVPPEAMIWVRLDAIKFYAHN
ncbi:hypothetical protein OIN60_19830 [Paenibacillus sp. P96]|uniref:Uncharacterized protein n=1 Tax=Paenibacillus zeirhizosphaerae TaxID=2987519 RepID=A0ABT9FW82_9BACL|nr:hypothetical protein [Paenibacillus sp. P96]MDP4098978.1 hypothetical protein [Paenibacillus sp. P96]